MLFRELGHSGLKVSALGLGCMGMWSFTVEATTKNQLAISIAPSNSVSIFWIPPICTGRTRMRNWWPRHPRQARQSILGHEIWNRARSLEAGGRSVNGRPDYIRRSCEGSLRRLESTPSIFTISIVSTSPRPLRKLWARWPTSSAKEKFDTSGFGSVAANLRRAVKVHPITALQTEYSLWSRDPEEEILATCRELGRGLRGL